MFGLSFPTNQQRAKSIVPTVRALDDPATWRAAYTPEQGIFTAAPNMGDNTAAPNCRFGVAIVIAFIETQMLRTAWPAGAAQRDRVERLAHHPFIVHIGAGDDRSQRYAACVGQDVPFDAELGAVGWIFARVLPPFGALTMALSSDDHFQRMPRRRS